MASDGGINACLIHLQDQAVQDHIRKQTASGYFTSMVLLDSQKAFDSVDHQSLYKKVVCYNGNLIIRLIPLVSF